MALALLPGDFLHVKPFHIAKPEAAELLFCMLDRDRQHIQGTVITENIHHLPHRRCGVQAVVSVVIPNGLLDSFLASDTVS